MWEIGIVRGTLVGFRRVWHASVLYLFCRNHHRRRGGGQEGGQGVVCPLRTREHLHPPIRQGRDTMDTTKVHRFFSFWFGGGAAHFLYRWWWWWWCLPLRKGRRRGCPPLLWKLLEWDRRGYAMHGCRREGGRRFYHPEIRRQIRQDGLAQRLHGGGGEEIQRQHVFFLFDVQQKTFQRREMCDKGRGRRSLFRWRRPTRIMTTNPPLLLCRCHGWLARVRKRKRRSACRGTSTRLIKGVIDVQPQVPIRRWRSFPGRKWLVLHGREHAKSRRRRHARRGGEERGGAGGGERRRENRK